MTCLDIIKKYLTENGFDGLVSDNECGCTIEDMPLCEECFSECTPAFKGPGVDGYDYMMYPTK
jgi:hypothetical protein